MRLFAHAPPNQAGVAWLMIYEDPVAGTYLFGSFAATDGSDWDHWYETVAAAQEAAFTEYAVAAASWKQIADPLADCQHDWVNPVRVRGRNSGQPVWGKMERLLHGRWVDFDPDAHPLSL